MRDATSVRDTHIHYIIHRCRQPDFAEGSFGSSFLGFNESMHHRRYQLRLDYPIQSCPPPRALPGLVDLPLDAYAGCNDLGDNRTAYSVLQSLHCS